MASTRNKNASGDYKLEQVQNSGIYEYSAYTNSAYGQPLASHFAGDGLIMGRMAASTLSKNNVDIESQLYGIGSTNLVTPNVEVRPELNGLKSVDIIDKLPLYVPPDFTIEGGQRPNRLQ